MKDANLQRLRKVYDIIDETMNLHFLTSPIETGYTDVIITYVVCFSNILDAKKNKSLYFILDKNDPNYMV